MKNLASLPGLSPEGIKTLRDLNKKYEAGEKIDPETANALKALTMANRVMTTVMNGGQVDPAFLKRIVDDLQKLSGGQKQELKKIIKKKKLKAKSKS